MKILTFVLVLIFSGIIALYIVVGRLGGGAQLQQDKALAAEIEARQALAQKRPDLALIYFDKALKAVQDLPQNPLQGSLQAGRGEALAELGRCPEAREAWQKACQSGQKSVCAAVCPTATPPSKAR